MKHKGFLLFKETCLPFIYICTNPPPGVYLYGYKKRRKSPSTSCHWEFCAQRPQALSTPPAAGALRGHWACQAAGSKAAGPSLSPPSLCSAGRLETKQKALSAALWGQPGTRTAAGTGASHSSGFPARGKCQFQKFPWTRICLFVSFFNRAEIMTHFLWSCMWSPKPQQPPAEIVIFGWLQPDHQTAVNACRGTRWQPLLLFSSSTRPFDTDGIRAGRLHGRISTWGYAAQRPRSPRAMRRPCLLQPSCWICLELQQSSMETRLRAFKFPARWPGDWTCSLLRSMQGFTLLVAGLEAVEQLKWALQSSQALH